MNTKLAGETLELIGVTDSDLADWLYMSSEQIAETLQNFCSETGGEIDNINKRAEALAEYVGIHIAAAALGRIGGSKTSARKAAAARENGRNGGRPPFRLEWYVLRRGDDQQIVSVTPGNDPLYGRGSWDMESGPYSTRQAAENAAETVI